MTEDRIGRRQFVERASGAAMMLTASMTSGAAGAANQPESDPLQSVYAGPLGDFDARDRQFDSLEFSLASYDHVKPSLGFSAADQRAAQLWQGRARNKLTELLGGFPSTRVPLKAQVIGKKEFANYTQEKIVFDSRDRLSVFGYLLLPRGRASAIPAVICLPGHGRGCDDIVGIGPDGVQRNSKSGYAKDFALQVVENGYAAFAIEQLAFGCRRDPASRKRSPEQSSCQPAAGAALLLGQTMIGWRVWDVMRAIDFLGTRAEIDSSRIATMGISGGGTVSLFAAALDERIKNAVVSGYFNTFRDSIVSISHCIDNYVPGILNYFEMYDLAGLIAPRGLFVESGTRDPIFPIQGSRYAYKKAQEIYATFGSQNRLGQEIFEGEHVFNGKGAFEYLKRWL